MYSIQQYFDTQLHCRFFSSFDKPTVNARRGEAGGWLEEADGVGFQVSQSLVGLLDGVCSIYFVGNSGDGREMG